MALHSRALLVGYVSIVLLWSAALAGAAETKWPGALGAQVEASQAGSSTQEWNTDTRIAHAVENELHHDAMVSLDEVSVQVEGGSVTLTGSVRSLLAKDRAARLAETVKGVLDVRNEIVVVPRTRMSADDLESTIIHALVTNPATEAFQIQVEAEPNGTVMLTGEVDSWAERELAGRVAIGVSGVTALRNHLEINYQEGRSDAEIHADIERLLQWDPYVDDSQIGVEVRDRVVRLSGSVPSAAEKRRVIAVARVSGTKSVDAKALQVQPEKTSASATAAQNSDKARRNIEAPSDAYIAQAVRTAIKADPVAEVDGIDVQVIGGVVTLYGNVASLQAKRAAVARAAATTGVLDVRNRLRVRDESTPRDEDIARNVIAALAVNPVTEAYKVSVSVRRGVATLAGHVDSWFERATADDVAAGVRGVRDVKNRLTVIDASRRLTYDPYVDTWSIYDHDWYTPPTAATWKQDSVIAEEIKQELAWSPFVDAGAISVSVRNGVATLTGTVSDDAERQAAAENAFEGGATRVVNHLLVEG